jgi:phosphomannomutase
MGDHETELFARARAWRAQDPDPETRAELDALIAAGDSAELAERMAGSLGFGTAGLRGVVGAGSARMNRAVVIRSARGLADTLLATATDARTLPVVVGYDGRTRSRDFAADAAGVLAASGLRVRFFDSPVPTPLVAYATYQLGGIAGLMITASHNPREYNGFKVYDADGAQLPPPHDERIAASIESVGPAREVPRVAGLLDGASERAEPVPEGLFDRYLSQVDVLRPPVARDAGIRIVYTPLHGVGWRYVEPALRRGGYGDLHVVPEQAEPDGDFPTLAMPNPEDPAALSLATALAQRVDADVILANDPDADRLAVSLPTPAGRWIPLTGNQIGLLLADYLLEHAPAIPAPLVLSTVVSSPMLAAIAGDRRARVEWTLTGFKWLHKAARELQRSGDARLALAYEEALGYSVGSVVRDKDGISAALLLADLVASCQAQGITVRQRLDGLYRTHGLWVSAQAAVERAGIAGADEIEAAVDRLAQRPPKQVGSRRVLGTVDHAADVDDRPAWRPAARLVELSLDGDARVMVRPSGTEPKLKIYVDLRVSVDDAESVRQRESEALPAAAAIAQQILEMVGLA